MDDDVILYKPLAFPKRVRTHKEKILHKQRKYKQRIIKRILKFNIIREDIMREKMNHEKEDDEDEDEETKIKALEKKIQETDETLMRYQNKLNRFMMKSMKKSRKRRH